MISGPNVSVVNYSSKSSYFRPQCLIQSFMINVLNHPYNKIYTKLSDFFSILSYLDTTNARKCQFYRKKKKKNLCNTQNFKLSCSSTPIVKIQKKEKNLLKISHHINLSDSFYFTCALMCISNSPKVEVSKTYEALCCH